MRDQNPPEPDAVIARIESEPAAAEIDLHPSCKVHRRIRRRDTDIAYIAGAIARRDIEAAAERDSEMREVPAHTAPLGIGFRSRTCRAGVFVAESEMVMHKIANGLNTRPAGRRIFEKPPGFVRQQVGLAITAAEQKLKCLRRQMLDLMLHGIQNHGIRCAAIPDDRIGSKGKTPGGSNEPVAPIAETVAVAFHGYGGVCHEMIGTFKVRKTGKMHVESRDHRRRLREFENKLQPT